MNSICLSTDSLPVLAWTSPRKRCKPSCEQPAAKRFARLWSDSQGLCSLACVLKEHNVPKVWAGLEATGPYSHALALWLHGAGHRLSLLNPRRVKQYARSAGNRNKTDLMDAAPLLPILFAL